jgi:EpsD family peptidyl-prolyl cis-trans isomerase
MRIRPILVFATFLLAPVIITGCGRKEDAKVATQVAARVNGEEITVHQINYVLARNQNITAEVEAQAKREILDRLIEQHLARQKAIENGLDRSPTIVQAIEAAKSEILARAYLEHITANLSKPVPVETHAYYKNHPELFAQRRVFSLEEIAFVTNSDIATALRAQLSKARSMQEIADWLQSQGVKFSVNRVVRAAEQLSLEILPKVQAMKEGQIQLFEAGSGRFQIIRVVAFKVVPIDEETATPRIKRFLSNVKSSEEIAKEMKKIKKQAKIEYMGEFAGGAAAAEAKAKPDAGFQTKSEESPKARSQE